MNDDRMIDPGLADKPDILFHWFPLGLVGCAVVRKSGRVVGGQMDVIQLLIARGAPLEDKNTYGATVLGQALWSALNSEGGIDYVPVIETLLAAGAKIEPGTLSWLGQQSGGGTRKKTRIAAYRWNGFGFSGIETPPECEAIFHQATE